MTINTKFPFYDNVLELLNPYLPMVLNDMSSNVIEMELAEEYDIEYEELFDEDDYELEFYEEAYEGEEEDFINIAISFERGFFPDKEMDADSVSDILEECDYEIIIKPFFTIKPYILIGLHNNKTKQYFAEIMEFREFQPIDILEKFALLVEGLFKEETLYNKIFIMTSMAHLAIRELISFDEPEYIQGNSGDVQYVSSPYFELDNPSVHEYLIKQKHFS